MGIVAAVALTGLVLHAAANDVPLNLPRPDGKPGDVKKKVKVYILAGQSNMVGMGDLTGARPPWTSIFLSADPAIIPGVMPIGGSAIARHGVFEAKATVYSGKQPVKTVPLALGTVAEKLPAMDGPQTVVVTAQIDVPASGTYTVHAGFEDSTHAVVMLDGKEVYRKDVGGKPVCAKVALEAGKRYPITITYFKGGSAAFWMEQVDLEGKGDLDDRDEEGQEVPVPARRGGQVDGAQRRVLPGSPARSEGGKAALERHREQWQTPSGRKLGFGYVMGTFHDEQVLLIKTAMGNRSLGFDFRPPSSGRTEPDQRVRRPGIPPDGQGRPRDARQDRQDRARLQGTGLRDRRLRLVPGAQGQRRDQGRVREDTWST